jgi:hypothetical protein
MSQAAWISGVGGTRNMRALKLFEWDSRTKIFGEAGDEPLLGATTLESIGLTLDPFKRRLIPMRMLLV